MESQTCSRSSIRLVRKAVDLDYQTGIESLVDDLDTKRGAYFSSGVEYPDRYSRWEFGFVGPPLEFIGRRRELHVNALNERGIALLTILEPLMVGPGTRVAKRTRRSLRLEVGANDSFFPEEERSRQPSLFSPIRRVIEDFVECGDPFLGFFGAFGYDLIHQFEPIDLTQVRGPDQKDLHVFLPDQISVLDRQREVARRLDFDFDDGKISTVGLSNRPFARQNDANGSVPAGRVQREGIVSSDHEDVEFANKVDQARQRMIAGDVFEVVLSRKFTAPYAGPPSQLFREMKRINPSPYEFFIQFGDEQLVGASPEMFVRVQGDRVESCPIAGTISRGANPMEDAERIRTLYNSSKDEAELTMCTDVDRNDKARICRPGSVRLLGRRLIERYAGLFHTVDHVEGRLRDGFTGIDAFLSHMWAVTLTGAPKSMAVRIIEDMESSPRRWYGGAIGGLTFDGGVNTGITIRTIHLQGGTANYRAGASLVFDSVGTEEEAETRIKATAFFRIMSDFSRQPNRIGSAPGSQSADQPGVGCRIVMIDNADSFVHTLADYFRQTGADVETYRWDSPVEHILGRRPNLVVHSPGPGRPTEFGMPDLVRRLVSHHVPQFGVCLGLQGIAEAFGGALDLLDEPHHGKVWQIRHDGKGPFRGLDSPCLVGAYHSLHAPKRRLPPELHVTAWTEEGLVMGLRHRDLPIAAVQFHPESILSMEKDLGLQLVRNVIGGLAVAERRPVAISV